MTDNLPKNNTQPQGFNVNIKVDLNNGTAATAFFVVLGVCCYMYINAKYNYSTTLNYKSKSLSVAPADTVLKA